MNRRRLKRTLAAEAEKAAAAERLPEGAYSPDDVEEVFAMMAQMRGAKTRAQTGKWLSTMNSAAAATRDAEKRSREQAVASLWEGRTIREIERCLKERGIAMKREGIAKVGAQLGLAPKPRGRPRKR